MITMLAACGSDTVRWDADKDAHWHFSESGEKINEAAHSLDEYDKCTVCGACIFTDQYDTMHVVISNKYNDEILCVLYDPDGNLAQRTDTEYSYDKNGNMLSKTVYCDGKLYMETDYIVLQGEYGSYSRVISYTTFNEDGTWCIEYTDVYNDICKEILYNADGSVAHEYSVEIEEDDEQYIVRHLKYDGEFLVEEVVFEHDKNYNSTVDRTYRYGILVKEEFYTYVAVDEYDIGYVYLSKVIIYNDDGTQTITEYDEYGRVK